MTVQQAIERANTMKAGNTADDALKIEWLNELEKNIYEDCICTHKQPIDGIWWTLSESGTYTFTPCPVYTQDTTDSELTAESQYDVIYIYWLMAKIDLFSQEMNKYNNDIAIFENAYKQFKNSYKRNHETIPMPQIKAGADR